MSKVNVFEQEWIDLVFEGRNKEYGAYKLRQESSKITIIALITGIGLILALVSIPAIVNHFNPQEELADGTVVEITPTIIKTDIETPAVIHKEPEPKKQPEPEPQKATPAPAAVDPEPTVEHKPFVAATDPEPVDLPDMKTVLTTKTGQTTSDGDGSGDFAIGTTSSEGEKGGTGTGEGEGNGTVDVVFVDVAPEYPGGLHKFYDQVGNRYRVPEIGEEKTIRVYVSFIVEKDGTMSNIQVLRNPGYGTGKEAIRVLKSIKTKWSQGMVNGKFVRTAYKLPITINIH